MTCENCGEALPWTTLGRPRKYCEDCAGPVRAAQRARSKAKAKHRTPTHSTMRHEDVVDTILEVLAQ